ncbi:putative chromatin remodeling & transcriptional activation CHROMO-DOMAIN family [Helianthus anomalus]
MRFKKGSKVEVMNKEVPASWCVAEIVSSNGHGYNVRYDGYEGVERVSRRFVRPSAPAIGSQNWVSGDIVEVFDENSWKVATVSKVLKGGRFLVRLHGSSHEIRAHKTNVRARQAWRDGQWVPIAKISGSNGVEPMIYQKEDNDARLQKHKRSSPFCSSLYEAKKVKHTEKDGSQSQRRVSTHSFEKVDAFEGKKYMQASFKNSLNGYYKPEKRKTYGVGCDHTRIPEPNESDTDECSVGSCSVPSNGPNNLSSHYDADGLSSDGESFNTSRVEHEVAASIHRLELHAYRSTLEALYASGPLSWEKEALLTNLRINLNISNDEHLTELRHLISSGARILD